MGEGGLRAPVAVEPLQLPPRAALPAHAAVGAGPDRVLAGIELRRRGGGRHAGADQVEVRQRRQQRGIRAGRHHPDGERVDDLQLLHQAQLAGGQVVAVGHGGKPVQAGLDGGGVQRGAVMALDAGPQLELPRQVVHQPPAQRDPRDEPRLVVQSDQAVVDVRVVAVHRAEPGQRRVQRDDRGPYAHRQPVGLLRPRRRRGQKRGRQQPGSHHRHTCRATRSQFPPRMARIDGSG